MNRIWKLTILIASIIILDQVTKGLIEDHLHFQENIPVIEGFFNLTYVKNPGAAFGMGANASPWVRIVFFLAIPVFACFWLVWLIWTSRNKPGVLSWAYAMILAGAIGNLIDRFNLKYVVDFLEFYYKEHRFPAFNVADSSISVAAGLLILDQILEWRKMKLEEKKNTPLLEKVNGQNQDK